ncbi:MAG TPA: MFS transporter, partial [Flavobacteriaceae bacterium]|nr:MFS transporter [Flavobacteriaceae bacterium]
PILPGWVWKEPVLVGANLAIIGMGIVMIGPNMYLAVFAQSVTGVKAIAAGFILASMSITWPLSSSRAGSLYLRFGFRNTALLGILFVILGSVGFLFVPYPGPVWMLVGTQLLLGAGFGLISTPLLVGVQSTVSYHDRGVVTGTNMFCRYFGQSIGAALLAVIFNWLIQHIMESAPLHILEALPHVNNIVDAMQSAALNSEVAVFLQQAFFEATQGVYLAMTVVGVLTLFVLVKTPARFGKIR